MIKVRQQITVSKADWLDMGLLIIGANTYRIKYTGKPQNYKLQLIAGRSSDKNIYKYTEDNLIRDAMANNWYLVDKYNKIIVIGKKKYDK